MPVSIVETPSIIMLLLLPPVDARSPIRLVPLTPGEREARAVKLRFAMGRFCTAEGVIEKDRSALWVWSWADSALTVMLSVRAPTSSVNTPRLLWSPALTATPGRFMVLKPFRLTSSVYVPGGMLGITKSPLADVVTLGSRVPRPSLRRLAVAPTIAADWPSRMLADNVPVVSCAYAVAFPNKRIKGTARIAKRIRVFILRRFPLRQRIGVYSVDDVIDSIHVFNHRQAIDKENEAPPCRWHRKAQSPGQSSPECCRDPRSIEDFRTNPKCSGRRDR